MVKASKNLRFRRAVFARAARKYLPRYKAVGVIIDTAHDTADNAKSLTLAGLVWGADWLRNHSCFNVEV